MVTGPLLFDLLGEDVPDPHPPRSPWTVRFRRSDGIAAFSWLAPPSRRSLSRPVAILTGVPLTLWAVGANGLVAGLGVEPSTFGL